MYSQESTCSICGTVFTSTSKNPRGSEGRDDSDATRRGPNRHQRTAISILWFGGSEERIRCGDKVMNPQRRGGPGALRTGPPSSGGRLLTVRHVVIVSSSLKVY